MDAMCSSMSLSLAPLSLSEAPSSFSEIFRKFILDNLDAPLHGNFEGATTSILFPDKLYLSSRLIVEQLHRGKCRIHGITHLVIVHDLPETPVPGVDIFQRKCTDMSDVMGHMDEIESYLRSVFEDPSSKVVILCNAGQTRSGMATCEFLRRYTGLDMETIFAFVKKQRSVIDDGISTYLKK